MKTTYILVGAALICTWLFVRGMLKRRLQKGGSYEDQLDLLERKAKAKDTLENIFVQIQDVSKECIAKLDNKIRMLNQLIIEADEKINKLSQLRDELKSMPKANSTGTANPLHQKIFGLAEKGLNPDEIAIDTGLEKGEVELILSLKNIKHGG